MKYLIINGSPRKKNTWAIVNRIKNNLEGDFDEINLSECDIPICKGCFNCFMNGEEYCPHRDYIKPIVEKLRDCDAIIMTSPVYALNVSALLKNFIDHTAYFYHRPEFFTKKAIVVVSTAGAGHKKVANYLDETLRHWGVNKVYKLSVACGEKDSLETDKIDKTAKKFGFDVKSGKIHSPKWGDIIFFDVWKVMALKDDPIPADMKFWFDTGLVNHDFSPDVKLGFVKKIFSKVMFTFLKRII